MLIVGKKKRRIYFIYENEQQQAGKQGNINFFRTSTRLNVSQR